MCSRASSQQRSATSPTELNCRALDLSNAASPSGDHDLQIFARRHHGGVAGFVRAHDQRIQVVVEILLRGCIKRGECLQHRAIERLEDVEEMLGRTVTEVEYALLGLD